MSPEWPADDHSPVHPAPLTRGELRMILGEEMHLNPNALRDPEESLEGRLRAELRETLMAVRVSVDQAEVIRRARMVRGRPAVKVAVALYSLGLPRSQLRALLAHLRRKGIRLRAFDLYSLCYRTGLAKVEHEVEFGELLEQSGLGEVLERGGLVPRARALYERLYWRKRAAEQGRRPYSVAREAFREALSALGVRVHGLR